jgi:hypothetical protein
VSLAKQILLRAAEMDLRDDPGELLWKGHGMVRGLKAAVVDITGGDDVVAYNAAYEPLSLLCEQLVPLEPRPNMMPLQRGRTHGEVRSWAADKDETERRDFLLTLAKELT